MKRDGAWTSRGPGSDGEGRELRCGVEKNRGMRRLALLSSYKTFK